MLSVRRLNAGSRSFSSSETSSFLWRGPDIGVWPLPILASGLLSFLASNVFYTCWLLAKNNLVSLLSTPFSILFTVLIMVPGSGMPLAMWNCLIPARQLFIVPALSFCTVANQCIQINVVLSGTGSSFSRLFSLKYMASILLTECFSLMRFLLL